jgi:hypothetical protein
MLCMPQVMGKSKVLVKVHPEGKYVVDIDKEIDIAELTPGEQGGKKNEEGRRQEDECAAVPAIAVTDRCSVGGQHGRGCMEQQAATPSWSCASGGRAGKAVDKWSEGQGCRQGQEAGMHTYGWNACGGSCFENRCRASAPCIRTQ